MTPTRLSTSILMPVCVALAGYFAVSSVPAAERSIVLQSTTSTANSGLYDHLLPTFTGATGIRVHVVAEPALALAVSLKEGGSITRLGEAVKAVKARVETIYPIGVEFDLIAYQPAVVEKKVRDFQRNLMQAVAIVLAVLAVVLHNATGLAAGYGLGRLLTGDERAARTLAIEVGMQNSGLAVALAVKYFAASAALPGALFSIWHNLSGSLLAAYWSRTHKS